MPIRLRPLLAGFLLLALSGCAGDERAPSATNLWLSASREPRPATMNDIRAALADGMGKTAQDASVQLALENLTGAEVLALAQARVDVDCTHFLNRIRAAQAGSSFTAIGISTTNALTVGIMGAASASAPAIAVVGASIAAANALRGGFDETVLMTQHADQIARLVAAEQTRVRAGALTMVGLAERTEVARVLGLAQGALYARTCNYSGLRRLLSDAIASGSLRAQEEAIATREESQALAAALQGIESVLGEGPVSIVLAARLRLAMDDRSRRALLPPEIEEAARRAFANQGRLLRGYFQQAERSRHFRDAVASLL